MKNLLLFLITCMAVHAQAQQFSTDLFGFRLGQYRAAVKGQLGKPFKSGKYDDNYEYEAYAIKPDKSLVAIFEYTDKEKDIVWSIQISGTDKTADIGFKNIKLGLDKAQAEKALGKPSSKKDIGDYGTMWEYDNANFSVEMDKSGKLSSIKILNNAHELFPSSPDIKKIPPFDKVRAALTSGNSAEIMQLLAGDAEVYYNKSTYSFKRSIADEQKTDHSKVFSIIKTISKDLVTVDTKSADYEENMRVALGQDTRHVIKIKKGHQIKEIVLKYFGGRYYIYEINADAN